MKYCNQSLLIFIFLFIIKIINISCISEDAIRKEIIINDDYYSYDYSEENSGEKILYIFLLTKKINILLVVLDDDDSSSVVGKYELFNEDSPNYNIGYSDIYKNNPYVLYMGTDDANKTQYIEYTYPKKHKILLIFRNYFESFYKYNFNFKYNEYYLENYYSIFLIIPLNDLNSNQFLPIKISGDLLDGYVAYNEGYQNNTINEVRSKMYSCIKNLVRNKFSNDTYIFYYKIYKNQQYNNLYLRVSAYSQKINIASLKISVINRQDINSNIMGSNLIYSGNYIAANLNNFNINEDILCIMYTNITNILDLYGIQNSEIENYTFGNNASGIKIYSNEKVSYINLSKEKKQKNIDTIIFEIANAKENYNFQLIFVSSEEYNIEINNYDSRQEQIKFIREIDSNNFSLNIEKKNIIINNFLNSYEKYFHFIDSIYGDLKYGIADMDSENFGDILKSQYSISPHSVSGSVDIKYLYTENNLYGYNEYYIKCNSYNGKNLILGEFIIICLGNNNKTEINMPSGLYYYVISLPIQHNVKDNYQIEFNNMNENIILDKNTKEYKNKWDYSKSKKITIENKNGYYVIVFFRTSIDSKINISESISDSKILQSKTLYALQLPKVSNNFEIYGVYQEISSEIKTLNLCVFHSITKNEYISLPPDASCYNYNFQNYSLNLNITSHGIKDILSDQEFLYTFIYFTSQNNNINLFYKHMLISNTVLESKTFLTPSYNIIYYPINKENDNMMLFTEIITKEIRNNAYPVSIENKNTTIFTFFKTIEILDYSNKQSCAKLININDITPYIKFWDIKIESLFLYEFGNELTYNYIENKNVSSEIIEADPNDYYLLEFKPFEMNGSANYDIFIFSNNSGYTFSELNNTYYIYKNFLDENSKINYYNKTNFDSLQSINGDFDEDIKNQFSLNLTGPKNTIFYILVISQKKNPFSYKIYNAHEIILSIVKRRKKINLNDTLEQTYCFNQKLLIDERLVITSTKITDNDILKDGSLIIQYINKNKNLNKQNFKIYSLKEGSEIIYNSTDINLFSYTLNTENVGDVFDITYETDSETEIKMCFEFIPSSGKKEYNEIIEYKYMTSVNFTYYVDTSLYNNILEVFRFSYNITKIENIIIYTEFYDSNKNIKFSKKFDKNYLKDIGDYKKYLGIYSTIDKKIIYITANIVIKSNFDIEDNLDKFYIERMETFDYTNNTNKIEISINENPKFYIYNLNTILPSHETLLFFTNLIDEEGFNIYKNNYFSNNFEKIDLALYPFKLVNEAITTTENGDKNIITLIVYNVLKSKDGFIDFSVRDEKFFIGENCDKEKFFESKLEAIYQEAYFLCYHKKLEFNTYNVSYTVEGPKDNIIATYFSSNIIYQSSINNILMNINENRLKEYTNETPNFNIINEISKFDIFKYMYFRRTNNSILNFKKWSYDEGEIQTTPEGGYVEEEESDHGALIYAIMFLSSFIVVIGIFTFKDINEKKKEKEKEKNKLAKKKKIKKNLNNSSSFKSIKIHKKN